MKLSLRCILHPERSAYTTAAQIPVCEECYIMYAEEAKQYLPLNKRVFYHELLTKDILGHLETDEEKRKGENRT